MKKITTMIMGALAAVSANALELPEIFGDNMMLQQQTEAKIWGWAERGNIVEVTTSWNNQHKFVTADNEGKWTLTVSTPAASYDQQSITIKEQKPTGKKVVETRTINNVLIGEVWFCSGQSNMEMPLGGFWNCPVEGANEAIAQSGKYRHAIRVATIDHQDAMVPQNKVKGSWEICEPKNASRFSACGYFFARTLNDIIDVPVGIINCSWGGSCVEGWLPKEVLETYPDGLVPFDNESYHRKMVMYNGMLHPLAGYTIKGFLWNQGESNVGREKEYIDRFKTMVNLWRLMWNQPGDKLPIYAVEIPPYDYGPWDSAALFREAQHQIARELENSGCVCTSDLIYPYEPKQIHGTQKLQIGQRLAYMAATRDYGVEGIAAEAPEFKRMDWVEASANDQTVIAGSVVEGAPKVEGKVMRLFFSNCTDGFDRLSDIEDFEACGEDGVWHPATVWADSDWSLAEPSCFLKLVCPEAGDIKEIRYCFKSFQPGKLHNMRGLPIVPFRVLVEGS